MKICDWKDALTLALKKFDYELAMSYFVTKGFFKRLLLTLTGKRPSDPAPEWNSEQLAGEYVRLFNKKYGWGSRIELTNGATLHSCLRYCIEDRLPVLTTTYYEDGTVYVEKYKFLRGGVEERLPVPYPYSEFGIWGLPEKQMAELDSRKKALLLARREIASILKTF